MSWTIEETSLGRVVVAPAVPVSRALFYTTVDFPGFLTEGSIAELTRFVRERYAIESSLATCHQVHGVSAIRVERSGEKWCELGGCDALWTTESHISLGIKVADCLPVTLIDSSTSLIANIHSGWRGSAAGITEATIGRIAARSEIDPSMTSAWLGPSIRVCCFEVGEEVARQFGESVSCIDRSFGMKPHLDLPKLTREVLRKAGLRDSAIHDSELCTRCKGSLFHSFRRDGGSAGRNLALVAQ
jgi:YfiH family protein